MHLFHVAPSKERMLQIFLNGHGMCKKLSGIIHQISTGGVTLVALLVFLLFTTLVLPLVASKAEAEIGDIGSPDLSFYYAAEDLYRMAEAYGEEGRQSYVRGRYTFDLVWPLVYTFFLITALSWLTRKAFALGSVWQQANLVPLLAALFDYLENVSTSIVMLRYPAQTLVLDRIATVFTMLKWLFVSVSFMLLLASVVTGIWLWLRLRKSGA
jgi:hypothetical protein